MAATLWTTVTKILNLALYDHRQTSMQKFHSVALRTKQDSIKQLPLRTI